MLIGLRSLPSLLYHRSRLLPLIDCSHFKYTNYITTIPFIQVKLQGSKMPFAIQITTIVNQFKVDSYLVEATDKEIITSPKLIKAAIFWREVDCKPHIKAFRTISDQGVARAVEVTSATETDLGRVSSSLLV